MATGARTMQSGGHTIHMVPVAHPIHRVLARAATYMLSMAEISRRPFIRLCRQANYWLQSLKFPASPILMQGQIPRHVYITVSKATGMAMDSPISPYLIHKTAIGFLCQARIRAEPLPRCNTVIKPIPYRDRSLAKLRLANAECPHCG